LIDFAEPRDESSLYSASASREGLIEIFTLGRFMVCCNGKIISDKYKRAQKMWDLFKYLFSHREKSIPQETLIELFWPEQESDDPEHALRNLIYRLRRVLAMSMPSAKKDLIISRQGSYSLNKEAPLWADIIQFENLCAEAHQNALKGQTGEAIIRYRQALGYYKGDYLPECIADWVFPLRIYYRNMFIQNFLELYSLLKENKDYDTAAQVCSAALMVAPFEEELHLRQIEALVLGGRIKQAREHYEYINRYLACELGVKPSLDVEQLLLRSEERLLGTVGDFPSIRQTLVEPAGVRGAFFCGPGLFQSICRLESRNLERGGNTPYLCQFFFKHTEGKKIKANKLNHFRYRLEEVLLNCLRKGDVVCRWNDGQYLVLLSNLNVANANKVVKRILSQFQKRCGISATSLLHSEILPLIHTPRQI